MSIQAWFLRVGGNNLDLAFLSRDPQGTRWVWRNNWKQRSAPNPSLDLYVVLWPENCLQRWVPSKENLVGFARRLGLVKSSDITRGSVYLPERKTGNLELCCLDGALYSAHLVSVYYVPNCMHQSQGPTRAFSWVAESERKMSLSCALLKIQTVHTERE